MKKTALAILVIFLVYPMLVVTTGCANMIPPTGGPRDSLPPVLMAVNPKDSTLHFQSKKIQFQFNEYVQLNNIQQQLIVSPTPKVNPIVENKLRTVTVTLKDTLEENTTYRLDFGNAIADINENNAIKNFSYIFSTGPALDSFELRGQVLMAETGAADSTLIVMLYTDPTDSAVVKERPRYIARLDKQGNYTFHNLHEGTYALYALKDEGGQRRYTSLSQLFAFADSSVTIPYTGTAPTLRAYLDSAGIEAPSTTGGGATIEKQNEKDKRMRIETNLQSQQLDLLGNLKIIFRPIPYKTFDSAKMVLTDEEFKPIPGYRIEGDTAGREITVIAPWTESKGYNLILQKDFATDTTGKQLLRTDTIDFRAKSERDYGQLRLRFLGLDMKRHPVLQFIQNSKVVLSAPLSTNEFNAQRFNPGEYDLRIYFDENENKKWDTGNFFGKRKQPEGILPISRKLTVKANWENEIDIRIDQTQKAAVGNTGEQ